MDDNKNFDTIGKVLYIFLINVMFTVFLQHFHNKFNLSGNLLVCY